MSRSRQSVSPVLPVARLGRRPVTGVAIDCEAGEHIAAHRHAEAQLIHAVSGAMTVQTSAGRWVVPPQRAVWVPPGESHAIDMSGRVRMRTVYVRPSAATGMPSTCTVVHVGPLLRELVVRIVELPERDARDAAAMRLVGVFLDEIRTADQMPLHLAMPADPRLQRIAVGLRDRPGDPRTLADWSRVAGGSERTLARAFVRETGLTFGQWRQQARLLAALQLLALGRSVTATALDLGYESPSAFIAAFRRALGATPGRYFALPQP